MELPFVVPSTHMPCLEQGPSLSFALLDHFITASFCVPPFWCPKWSECLQSLTSS